MQTLPKCLETQKKRVTLCSSVTTPFDVVDMRTVCSVHVTSQNSVVNHNYVVVFPYCKLCLLWKNVFVSAPIPHFCLNSSPLLPFYCLCHFPHCYFSALHTQTLTEFRDCFSLFDKTGEDKIAYYEVGECLRAFGQNPTNAEIAKVLNNPTQDGNVKELNLERNRI